MKPETPDPLLNEVLDDGAAFRSATLRQTLVLARTRRRHRIVNRALLMTTILAGAIGWLLPRPSVPESKPAAVPAKALRIVHTVPLASADTIRTATARIETVHTAPTPIVVVSSRGDAVARVSSGSSDPMVRYLDDRQLLAAFPGEHPILIFPGTPDAHLVFR